MTVEIFQLQNLNLVSTKNRKPETEDERSRRIGFELGTFCWQFYPSSLKLEPLNLRLYLNHFDEKSISFSSSNNQLRIPNFCNKFFVYLLFEYFYQAKVLDWYHNIPKNANTTLYTKKIKTLCNTLKLGNWNSGFVKLVVQWAERDKDMQNDLSIDAAWSRRFCWLINFLIST